MKPMAGTCSFPAVAAIVAIRLRTGPLARRGQLTGDLAERLRAKLLEVLDDLAPPVGGAPGALLEVDAPGAGGGEH